MTTIPVELRELLERCRKRLHDMMQADLSAELSVLLAEQPQDGARQDCTVESDAWLQEWARDKFTSTGRYKGSVYGNTDWALARALHSALLATPQRPARHDQANEVRRLREALEFAVREQSGDVPTKEPSAWLLHARKVLVETARND